MKIIHNKFMALTAYFTLMLFAEPVSSGPISKWSDRPVDVSFHSAHAIFDIERCLIDLGKVGGIPIVYSQPDRPNIRMLVWQNDNMDTTGRVDLEQVESGTYVKIWKIHRSNRAGTVECLPDIIKHLKSEQ